jgi:hypothetical protein
MKTLSHTTVFSALFTVLIAAPVLVSAETSTVTVTSTTGDTTTQSTVTFDVASINNAALTLPLTIQAIVTDIRDTIIPIPDEVLTATPPVVESSSASQSSNVSSTASTNTTISLSPIVLPESCTPLFLQNFIVGDTHPSIATIQVFLNKNLETRLAESGPGSTGNESTYFGSLTEQAVKKFQTIHAAAVLTPLGLTEATGYWGSRTRAQANLLNCTQ